MRMKKWEECLTEPQSEGRPTGHQGSSCLTNSTQPKRSEHGCGWEGRPGPSFAALG